jgi:hypothetical protein
MAVYLTVTMRPPSGQSSPPYQMFMTWLAGQGIAHTPGAVLVVYDNPLHGELTIDGDTQQVELTSLPPVQGSM